MVDQGVAVKVAVAQVHQDKGSMEQLVALELMQAVVEVAQGLLE
jgi:hypothetical protein